MSNMSATRVRIQRLLDERATVTKLHEDLLAQAESRQDEQGLNDVEKSQIDGYRDRAAAIDTELEDLGKVLEREENAAKVSANVRKHLAVTSPEMQLDGEQPVYRTFAAYARDEILTKRGGTFEQIAQMAGGEKAREAARERLLHTRAPVHTLSSDVEGLQPEQHIAQILDVINSERPLVASARRYNLTRGKLTYPRITSRPEVDTQGDEKTEGGNEPLNVEMVDATATTYIGGGNLSWQAIEWSTPDALELWFRLAAEHYAIKTEEDAGDVLSTAAAANTAGSTVAANGAFDEWLTAIVSGAAEVYGNSRAMADTVYLAPDMFFAAAALTSDSGAMLINAGQLNLAGQSGTLAGMRVVVSGGLPDGFAGVGDSSAFIVAENAGAPVRLQATEPAIGGVEVGIIGAFEAVAFSDDRFSQISTGGGT